MSYGYPEGQQSTPPPNTTQQSSRYPNLNNLVRSEDGFKKSVAFSGGANAVLGVVLGVAALMLIRNIIATVRTLSEYDMDFSRYFVRVFFSTEGVTGGVDPMLWAMVWLPIIAIPILIIVVIIKFATRNSSLTKLHQRFMAGGFLVDTATATGLQLTVTGGTGQLFLFAQPGTDPAWVTAAAQQVATMAAQDKQYLKTISKTTKSIGAAVPASLFDPSIPAGIWAVASSRDEVARPSLALPQSGKPQQLELLGLKKDVVIS